MSNDQANQQLVTALDLFTTSNICEVVGTALLAYDHLLTLSGEIQFVWGRKFSGATVVFVLNRYVTLFGKIILPISTFWWPNQTDHSLEVPAPQLLVTSRMLTSSKLQGADHTNRDVLGGGLFHSSDILNVARVRHLEQRLEARTSRVARRAVYPVANMYHYIPSVPGRLPGHYTGAGSQRHYLTYSWPIAIAIHSCAIATDLLVLILTWVKTYHIKKLASILETEASFATLILRDGSLYLGAMLVLNVIDLVILRSDVLFDPLPVFIDVFTCILISRFMLNLRQIAGRGNDLPSASQLQATSRFSSVWFSPDIIGDLGASLSYAGFGGGLDEGFPGEEVGASSCDTTDLRIPSKVVHAPDP